MRAQSSLLALLLLMPAAACSDDDGEALTNQGSGEEEASSSSSTNPGDGDAASSESGDGDGDAESEGEGDGDGDGEGTGDGDGESSGDGDGGGDGDGDGDGDGALPNINMEMVADIIAESAYTQTITVSSLNCAYIEGCVDGTGPRRLLRFDTITPNDGDVDLEIGHAGLYPDMFEWGECHDHYHFKDFAFYRLLEKDSDRVVVAGHKQAFALIDVVAMGENPGPPKFPLPDGSQGITVGWADVYGAYLDCQWVDVTDVPSGEYRLEISINPEQVFAEKFYDDNLITVDVTLTDQDTGPTGVPPDWTCLDSYYDDDDGCHCGCGVVDPDCPNPTAEACESCEISGSCAIGLGCEAIAAGNNAICGD